MSDMISPPPRTEYHFQDFEWESLRAQSIRQLAETESKAESCSGRRAEDLNIENDVEAAQSSWEMFHKRHSTAKFFKERRYLLTEFSELSCESNEKCSKNDGFVLLEVGCGSGSSIIPILRNNPRVRVIACDCSESAVHLTRVAVESAIGLESSDQRFRCFVGDVMQNDFRTRFASSFPPSWNEKKKRKVGEEDGSDGGDGSAHDDAGADGVNDVNFHGVDSITLIFTLSALHPSSMATALSNLHSILKPGGRLFFRDYGLYDMTMLRFPFQQRILENFYRREDGTFSYFFSEQTFKQLCSSVAFHVEECNYCCVSLPNRKKGMLMHRVWLHAKCIKA